MSQVSELIRHARTSAGLTQSELARRAGTSQANVAKYEAGRMSPAVSTLERLLRAAGFGLHIDAKPDRTITDLSGDRARRLRRHRVEVIEIARRHGATDVRVFGSVARGDDDADSDIDLLVEFDQSQGLLPIVAIKQELEALLGESVDVAPVSLLKPAVARRALEESLPL